MGSGHALQPVLCRHSRPAMIRQWATFLDEVWSNSCYSELKGAMVTPTQASKGQEDSFDNGNILSESTSTVLTVRLIHSMHIESLNIHMMTWLRKSWMIHTL